VLDIILLTLDMFLHLIWHILEVINMHGLATHIHINSHITIPTNFKHQHSVTIIEEDFHMKDMIQCQEVATLVMVEALLMLEDILLQVVMAHHLILLIPVTKCPLIKATHKHKHLINKCPLTFKVMVFLIVLVVDSVVHKMHSHQVILGIPLHNRVQIDASSLLLLLL
jgi:hypothetical protein